MQEIRRILVPTDFSPQAELAARFAVDLAERLGASVTLFNAYQVPIAVPFPDGSAYIPSPEAIAELATATTHALKLERDRLQRAGVEIAVASAEGSPREIITRIAREGGYDLVVMGTHGRTGLAHLVMGSVAEATVRNASCPVVTVPSPHRKERSRHAPVL